MRKVLAIDGGGLKGVFPASFLTCLEEQYGPIADYFDLIVGTSTGGIIALGLGMGLPSRDILDLYMKKGANIFPKTSKLAVLRILTGSIHKPEVLKRELQQVFADRRLGESTSRLVIPSYDVVSGEVRVFKTAHHHRLKMDYKQKVIDVAMATAAAPLLLPPVRNESGEILVDGGVWANNPCGVAAVEAVAVLGWTEGNVRMLSLGCTAPPPAASSRLSDRLRARFWATMVPEAVMRGQASGSLGVATLLFGKSHVERCSPIVQPGVFSLAKAENLELLKGLGVKHARHLLLKLGNEFFAEKAEPFHPIYELD